MKLKLSIVVFAIVYFMLLYGFESIREHKELRDLWQGVLVIALLVSTLFSLIVGMPILKGRKWMFVPPVLSVMFYSFYEASMPSWVDIRMDIPILYFLVGLSVLGLISRGFIYRNEKHRQAIKKIVKTQSL